MTSPKKRPRGRISDKMRLDFLVGEVLMNWPYRTRNASEGWRLTFDFRSRHGLRSGIDAAIRASKSKGGK